MCVGGQRVGCRSQGAVWVPVAHLDWPVVVLRDRLGLDVGLHLPIQEVLDKLAHGSRTVERGGEERRGGEEAVCTVMECVGRQCAQ